MEEIKSKVATQFKMIVKKIVLKYLREAKTVKYKNMLVTSDND